MPRKSRGKLTLKGENSLKSRMERLFKKFGKDATSTFVGEGKMFRPRKKKKAMGGMKMKYGHGGRYSQHD
tara:strand:+ start:290 stop:499 length:210 start_codon:yes stop_codon:yes gene_type:complete